MNRRTLSLSAMSFGRRVRGCVLGDAPRTASDRADARLFALTFAGGFLFISVYLA